MPNFIRGGRYRAPSGCCAKCGLWREALNRDHIVPKYKGGSDDASNIQLLCANCHEDKTRLDLKGRTGRCLPATRRKISEANRGRKRTPESMLPALIASRGRKKSPEEIEKTATKLRGVKRSPDVMRKAWATRRLKALSA